MRYFLDAEFNGFGGDLVSLALVPETEGLAPFHAALDCPAPTAWVAEHVLPVLDVAAMPRAAVVDRFAAYLIDDPEPLLVADWPEDIAHAALLLISGPGRMKPVSGMRFELVDPLLVGSRIVSQVPHNAYHDALALRAAVLDYERRMAD